MTDDEPLPPVGRRRLLAALTAAAASGTAGCSVHFDDGGFRVDFGGDGTATSPPGTDRTQDDGGTPGDDEPPSDDGPDESTGTASAEGEAIYGRRGYGVGGYGGADP